MTRALAIAAAALLVAGCAPRMGGRDRGMVPTSTTLEALDRALEPRRFAVAIGIDAYDDPGIPDLRLAGADAAAIADRLGAHGRFDEVIHLGQPEVTTRSAIFRVLRELSAELRRPDTLVVYFSGHGTRVPDGDTWRRFLLVSDTDPADLDGTAIDLTALQTWFSRQIPSRKAIIVDACFDGDGRSTVRPVGTDPAPASLGSLTPLAAGLSAGEAHLMATSAGRPAREVDSLGHGVYTFHLLDALSWGLDEADKDDDGVVTAYEAHDHARGAVMAYTQGEQIPEAVFRILGTADVVLGGDPARQRRREDALIYLYASDDTPLGASHVIVDGRDRGLLPGSVTVASGKQRVELVHDDGQPIASGRVRLRPGATYRADRLARILSGPSVMVGVHGAASTVPLLRDAYSKVISGPELFTRFRQAQRSPRGLFLDVRSGFGAAELLRDQRAVAAWGSLGTGWQRDVGALRLALGLQTGAWLLPPGDDRRVRLRQGWWSWGVGPMGDLGLALGSDWAVVGGVRMSFGALLDEDGELGLVAQPTASVGIELSL